MLYYKYAIITFCFTANPSYWTAVLRTNNMLQYITSVPAVSRQIGN